jgi:16S rRNA (cytosine967-C5)-methyltransferase
LKDLRALTQLQRELIASGVSALTPSGVLGYATCSPHLAETTVQVADLLRTFPHLEQISVVPFLPVNLFGADRSGALSLWTHKHGTDAMYLALFRSRAG